MNVLANRVPVGVVSGVKLTGSQYQGSDSFARRIGYAQQQDLHLTTATVREALQFSALLRQPQNYSKVEKLAYAEEIIQTLDMEEFADAIVGVPGEGEPYAHNRVINAYILRSQRRTTQKVDDRRRTRCQARTITFPR